MSTQTDCLSYLTRKFIATSQWRQTQAVRWPDDSRNARARDMLWRIATNASEITDDQWRALEPLYNPRDARWCDLVARCARDVGFRSGPQTFAEFIAALIEESAVAA